METLRADGFSTVAAGAEGAIIHALKRAFYLIQQALGVATNRQNGGLLEGFAGIVCLMVAVPHTIFRDGRKPGNLGSQISLLTL